MSFLLHHSKIRTRVHIYEQELPTTAALPHRPIMQKVIKRTIMAEKMAARRIAKRREQTMKGVINERKYQAKFMNQDETRHRREERIARREDWELGPLAPRRDVGDKKETYGALTGYRLKGVEMRPQEEEKLKNTAEGRFLNIVAGDRVVLLDGKDKGKIGKVTETDWKRRECTVEGLNMVDFAMRPYQVNPEDPDQSLIRSMPKPVPLSSVRLIYALTDPETGVTRDVIVKKLVNGNIYHDKHTGSARWSRIIPGLDIKVPWPKAAPKEYKDALSDTLRLEVETQTFIPTLLRPPMPASVIDELRNRYSKFRTRHDPEYVARKEQEDRAEQAKKVASKEMMTPLMELNRKERKLRRAKGKGHLTEDMLQKIGGIIADKRQIMLKAAGVSKKTTSITA